MGVAGSICHKDGGTARVARDEETVQKIVETENFGGLFHTSERHNTDQSMHLHLLNMTYCQLIKSDLKQFTHLQLSDSALME